MKTILLNKRNLQAILKSLRGTKYLEITKLENGYEVTANQDGKSIKKGDVLLKAMKGTNGYLVSAKEGMLMTS